MYYGRKDDHHYMAKNNVGVIIEDCDVILNIIEPDDEFPDWMEFKASRSATHLYDVRHALYAMSREGRHILRKKNPVAEEVLSFEIGSGDYMFHYNIEQARQNALDIDRLIKYDMELPDWCEHYLSVARVDISKMASYLTWLVNL